MSDKVNRRGSGADSGRYAGDRLGLDESLLESHGLRVSGPPLVHAQGESFQVEAEIPERPEDPLDADIR